MAIDMTKKEEMSLISERFSGAMGYYDPEEELSDDFKLKEFTYSATANKNGIDNTPDDASIDNLRVLARQLQFIRDAFGGPIGISSGYRSQELQNLLVAGGNINAVDKSLHSLGMAADIYPVSGPQDLKKLFALIVTDEDLLSRFGEVVILEKKGIIHVQLPSSTLTGVPMYADTDGLYKRFTPAALQSFVDENPVTAVVAASGISILLIGGVGLGLFFLIKKLKKQ